MRVLVGLALTVNLIGSLACCLPADKAPAVVPTAVAERKPEADVAPSDAPTQPIQAEKASKPPTDNSPPKARPETQPNTQPREKSQDVPKPGPADKPPVEIASDLKQVFPPEVVRVVEAKLNQLLLAQWKVVPVGRKGTREVVVDGKKTTEEYTYVEEMRVRVDIQCQITKETKVETVGGKPVAVDKLKGEWVLLSPERVNASIAKLFKDDTIVIVAPQMSVPVMSPPKFIGPPKFSPPVVQPQK
jgi:hypothetical protein